MIWTTKRIKHDIAYDKLESMICNDVWVPADMNPESAQSYGMLPDQPIGRYIVKLNGDIKSGAVDLTKGRARFITLLTLSGVLRGVSDYCFDNMDADRSAKRAYNFLLEDDICVEMGLKDIFAQSLTKRVCNDFVYSLNRKGCSFVEDCSGNYRKSRAFSSYDNVLQAFYSKHDGDNNPQFLRDLGRMLCRHTHPQYDSRNSFWDVKNPGYERVYDICDLIKAVRTMGDQYVLAPVFNLYAESVLRCVRDCRQFLSR